jgi:hypothetical protein
MKLSAAPVTGTAAAAFAHFAKPPNECDGICGATRPSR